MTQRKRQVLASILIFIFALHYVDITFFYHDHNINGFIISHSHIHGGTHVKTGTHSASELSLISALSDFQSLQAVICFAGTGLFLICLAILPIGSERKSASTIPCHSYLRAPPILF